MVDVMVNLLIIAEKIWLFSFFSDFCYLTTTLDEFYNFFIRNNNKTFINYKLEKYFLFKNTRFILYKDSQRMSLHKNIVHKLLDNLNIMETIKKQ